jgi:hypothetical protein
LSEPPTWCSAMAFGTQKPPLPSLKIAFNSVHLSRFLPLDKCGISKAGSFLPQQMADSTHIQF